MNESLTEDPSITAERGGQSTSRPQQPCPPAAEPLVALAPIDDASRDICK